MKHSDIDHTGLTGVGGSLTIKDEGTPLATGATSLDFVGAGVTATGSGAAKTITIPGGGAPLGVTQYVRGTDGTILTTNSIAMVDVDATNCKVTFTAPASGNVIVEVEAFASSDPSNYIKFGLREGSADIAGPALVVNSTAAGTRARTSFYLTGLGAGSHTYKLSAGMSTAANGSVLSGPLFGSVFMVVWAA